MTERLPFTDEVPWQNILGAADGTGGFLRVAHNDDGSRKDVFDVKQQFGAVGDGITDDTAAIQGAIDAAAAAGGGIVYVPPGNFVISAPLTLKTNVSVQGASWASELDLSSNFASAAMITLDSTSVVQTTIRNLFLNGNKASQVSPVTGVAYSRVLGNPNHVIEDCFLYSWSGRGIDCDAQSVQIRNNYFYACDENGIYVSYHDAKLINNSVGASGLEGIYLDGASNTNMSDNLVWGSGQVTAARGDGIRIQTGGVLKAVNNESSDNERHGWNLDNTYYCTIIGGGAQDNNAAASGGAAIRANYGGEHLIRMYCAGGGRATESSLLQFDTNGSGYPFNCNIELAYKEGSGGPIGAGNPEIVGTVAETNLVKINQRIVHGGIGFGANPALTGAIRLTNDNDPDGDCYITARNAADNADVNVAKFNALNEFHILSKARFADTTTYIGDLIFDENVNIHTSTVTGTKIGTLGGASGHKLAFWNSTPIVQPLLATGAAHTVDDVITVLQNLGLVRQS